MAVPNVSDLVNYLEQIRIRLNKSVTNKITILDRQIKALANSYVLSNPLASFEIREQKLDGLIGRLNQTIVHKLELAKRRYNNVLSNHILTNPEDMLIKYNNALELNK